MSALALCKSGGYITTWTSGRLSFVKFSHDGAMPVPTAVKHRENFLFGTSKKGMLAQSAFMLTSTLCGKSCIVTARGDSVSKNSTGAFIPYDSITT